MSPVRQGPTVSVVIPALDEEASLPKVIRSAREAGADEVVVVDGGSTDGTLETACRLADAALASAAGRAMQMNAGARRASGAVLLFLHADTELPHGSIDAVRMAMRNGGCLGGAFRVRLSLSAGASIYRTAMLRLTGRMINLRARLFRAYTGDQGIFVRREVFEAMGAYPEIPLMEDVALSRLLTARGETVLLPVPITTSARRWEAQGPARTILLMWGLRLAHRLGMSPERCAEIYQGSPRPKRDA
ncbi:MAG: TIGR04283 family arsenosugar biosynthesis glycosyltransferase [Deltaproteobacteria bacterium]|nr:TIGR04283 family arsenosugar biosynthesis glycosyltransferase [Deltaproteobacteria bacterium]